MIPTGVSKMRQGKLRPGNIMLGTRLFFFPEGNEFIWNAQPWQNTDTPSHPILCCVYLVAWDSPWWQLKGYSWGGQRRCSKWVLPLGGLEGAYSHSESLCLMPTVHASCSYAWGWLFCRVWPVLLRAKKDSAFQLPPECGKPLFCPSHSSLLFSFPF